jgi:hypothetical protein
MITWTDFEKTDMRVDTIIAADDFAAAKKTPTSFSGL